MILTVGEAAFVIAVGTQTVSRTQEQRACWVITSVLCTESARRVAYYHTSLSALRMQYLVDLYIYQNVQFTSRAHRTELYPTMQCVFKSALNESISTVM